MRIYSILEFVFIADSNISCSSFVNFFGLRIFGDVLFNERRRAPKALYCSKRLIRGEPFDVAPWFGAREMRLVAKTLLLLRCKFIVLRSDVKPKDVSKWFWIWFIDSVFRFRGGS